MSSIVADAGPLIGLARAGLLELLPKLYSVVEVPNGGVAIDRLTSAGYRLSPGLRKEILRLAAE